MKQRTDYYEQIQEQEEKSHKAFTEAGNSNNDHNDDHNDSQFVHTRPKGSFSTICEKCGRQMDIRLHQTSISWYCFCGHSFDEPRKAYEKTGDYYE